MSWACLGRHVLSSTAREERGDGIGGHQQVALHMLRSVDGYMNPYVEYYVQWRNIHTFKPVEQLVDNLMT